MLRWVGYKDLGFEVSEFVKLVDSWCFEFGGKAESTEILYDVQAFFSVNISVTNAVFGKINKA